MAMVLALGLMAAPLAHAEASKITYNIPAENTAQALNDFAKQSGLQLLFPYDVAVKFMAAPLRGAYSRDEALALLLGNTGLEIASESETTIVLRVITTASGGKTTEAPEIIVTGTHIRGGNPTSPVHLVTRKDIEESGYSQIGDVVRNLPENFSGGQNPGVIAAGATNIGNQNASDASTVNLRGLGTDATLVLLNGHRLSADSFYQGSDISGIPLAAIQRLEIVPDGASALYGSDAVAGVANFILRKNFSGGEVSARLGTTSQGGGTEKTFSALEGLSGDKGYVIANLEISRQEAITAGSRAFTALVPNEGTLIPGLQRRSLFLGAGRDLNDAVSVSIDGLLADRSSDAVYHYSADSAAAQISVYTPSYNLAATLDSKLAGDWKLRLTAVAAGSHNSQHYAYPDYGISGVGLYSNSLAYGEVTADGTLFALPAGQVKAALGGGFRRERYEGEGDPAVTRTITYAYGEVLAPLIAPSGDRAGLNELELSLSGRAEHYSDFGSSANPRIGLRYLPIPDLTLRTSWGTSFKAPSFLQMHEPFDLFLYPAAWFGYTGGGTGLMTWGGNPNLKPERATSRTLGADYSPSALKSLKLTATWFDIDYKDRVVQPISNYTEGLSDPVYAPFIDLAPSAASQASLIANADLFYNATGNAYDPTTVVATLNNRYSNATAQTVKGLDIGCRQAFALSGGTMNAFANGSWLQLTQQTIASAPKTRLSGTIFNSPSFKGRGGLNWQSGHLSATAIVNYIAPETDTGVTPNAHVASWTTVDATIAYSFGSGSSNTQSWKALLSASNLFDKSPPYTVSPTSYEGLHFDSTNASIIGRFVSLTLSRDW